jgi:hypothetical protein
MVGAALVAGALVTSGVLADAALVAGELGALVLAATEVEGGVDVDVVDVDVDVVLELANGADASGLESWSSRAHPAINTTTTAAAADSLRTAAVFHDTRSGVIATPLVEPRSDRQNGAPRRQHDPDVLEFVGSNGHEHETDEC